MARKASKKTNGTNDTATAEVSEENRGNKGANVADIKSMIQDCSRGMIRIKDQRAELNEEAKEIRERLRNGGVDVKAFEAALRLYQMEQEAKGNYLDWLRVSFEALGIGEQASMFPDSGEEVGDEQLRKARQAGKDASFEGKNSTDNPHPNKSPLRAVWHEGWLEQQGERAQEMAPKEGAPNFIAGQEAAGTA